MTNIILNEVGTIKRQLELAIEQEFVNTCEDEIRMIIGTSNLTEVSSNKDELLERLSEIENEQDLFITTETDIDGIYITVSK